MSSQSPEFAVLVPLLTRKGEDYVVLTKRTEQLSKYSGQVSFPGGARDRQDATLRHTALRETHEELGLEPTKVELLDELDWFTTGLGHRVKPFVGRLQEAVSFTPNPDEVDQVLYLPVAIVEADPFSIRDKLPDGRPIYTFDFQGHEVWGLTAGILRRYFVADEF